MKVLVINTNLTDKNGVASVIFNYLHAIDKNNLQMDLLSINYPNQQYIDDVEKYGGHLYVIERSSKNILKYWYDLYKLISKQKYDIVHIHGNSHTLVLELSAAWVGKCKVRIAHSHNTKCEHNIIHKIARPLFDYLTTDGLACGVDAGKWMFGNRDYHVLNNGINTSNYVFSQKKRDEIRKKLNLSEDSFVVGHVGYFYEVKNHRHIINVFEELHRRDNKYRLMLIGDGILKDEIIRILKEKELYKYSVLTGNISNVNDYLNAIDAIIMPSIYEGLPLTLIEEQANGLQCVVSKNITCEVNITGNVHFLPLDAPLYTWADCVEQLDNNKNRIERSKCAVGQIKKCGYDIFDEAQFLRDYYLSAVNRY